MAALEDALDDKQDSIPPGTYGQKAEDETITGEWDFTTAPTVNGTPIAGSVPDATSGVKGKVQLAGDLAGTAASPTVPGLALKLDLADAAPLSDNTPLAPAGGGDAGAGDEGARWDHAHPDISSAGVQLDDPNTWTALQTFDEGIAVTEVSTFGQQVNIVAGVGGANGVLRLKNTAAAVTLQILSDANDVVASIHDDGRYFGKSFFADSDLLVGIQWEALHVGLYGEDGLYLQTAGAYIQFKSPDGATTKRLAIGNDGTFNLAVGSVANSWTDSNLLFATKTPGGTPRVSINNFGDTTIDVHSQNAADNAVWGSTVPLTVRHDGTGTLSGNLAAFKLGATTKAAISKNGALGVWGVTPPASQPATPVTLADVIAVLQGCGLAA